MGKKTQAVTVSMFFADKVFREEAITIEPGNMLPGKVHISGIFELVISRRFPVRIHNFGIYQKLADITGPESQEGKFEMRYLDGNLEKVLEISEKIPIPKDRLGSAEMCYNISGIVFPRPGKVQVDFYLNDAHVNQGTFELVKLGENSNE